MTTRLDPGSARRVEARRASAVRNDDRDRRAADAFLRMASMSA